MAIPEGPDQPRVTGRGWGRTLVFVYAVMAVSATGRSSFQLAVQFHQAPVPYLLSAFSAVVYVVATIALARNHWHVALAACLTELVGVLAIGTASVTLARDFPQSTVWSQYGIGYGCLPLVLPVAGLWWLWRRRPRGTQQQASTAAVSSEPRTNAE